MSDATRRLPWSGFKDRRAEQEAIVREVADRGPYVAESDALGDVCAMCGRVGGLELPLADPTSHEPWCPWRRAKALHPGVTSEPPDA